MVVTTTAVASRSRGLLRLAPLLAAGLALLALVLLALAPVGWRAGLWHYRTSFFTMMQYAAWCGVAAGLVGAATLLLGRARLGTRGIALSAAALVAGLVAFYVPWQWDQKRQSLPPIHDITTDFADPPPLRAVMPAREAEQAGSAAYDAKVGEQQKKAYPGVAPATLPVAPAEAFKRVLAVAQAKGWTIVRSDPAAGEIEASEKSFWFGFTDDVAVRVRAEGQGSRVDMRSVSRQGRNDFGVNAARIEGFMAALKAG